MKKYYATATVTWVVYGEDISEAKVDAQNGIDYIKSLNVGFNIKDIKIEE